LQIRKKKEEARGKKKLECRILKGLEGIKPTAEGNGVFLLLASSDDFTYLP
jgi:hypothetical protein